MTLSGILNNEFTTISKEPSSIVCIKAAVDYNPNQWCFSLALLKRTAYKAIIPLGVFWLAQKYGLSVDFFSNKNPPKFHFTMMTHLCLKMNDMGIAMNALIVHLALKIAPGSQKILSQTYLSTVMCCAWEIENWLPHFIILQLGPCLMHL